MSEGRVVGMIATDLLMKRSARPSLLDLHDGCVRLQIEKVKEQCGQYPAMPYIGYTVGVMQLHLAR